MIFKSIRWRLQLWYGLLLVAVLAGFGITAYQFERGRVFKNLDDELQRRASALIAALPRQGPGAGRAEGPFGERPPPEDPLGDGPPHGGPPDGRPPDDRPPPREFKLPARSADLFGGGKDDFYYFVWLRDGREYSRSTNVPMDVRFPGRSDGSPPQPPHQRGAYREVIHFTPLGEGVLAGRSTEEDVAGLRHFAWGLAGVGAVVLLCGLAGGWWLVAGAIRPIEDISSTAVKIAAGDLSQRINVEDTENELGRLAGVLNSTFARLEAAFAQQGQFTADAAHELRTPVTVILTQTQTALKHERDASEYRATVEACQRAAQRMRRLLESLLELTRLDAGQESMRQRRFDLSNLVHDCVELVQPLANEREIKIAIELPALELAGDPERLAQVFTNLLTNAIHYNKERGEVRVTAERQHGSALVTVNDTGRGISAEDLPRVFERFYRADKSRSGTGGQNGLGLSISKAIVEAHGGAIEVSSQVGRGTNFVVRLPLNDVKN